MSERGEASLNPMSLTQKEADEIKRSLVEETAKPKLEIKEMALNEGPKKGDLIEAGRWLKKMGHVKMNPNDTKTRNAYALVQKGKFVLAQVVSEDKADTVVNYDGKMTAFKRIKIDKKVRFDEDRITVFPAPFWEKATKKNLFLGTIKREQDENPFEDK